MMAYGLSGKEATPECISWLKRILTIENNYERMASSLNYASLEERVRIEEKLFFGLQNPRNDDEKHHHKLLRYSEMNNRKVESTMKRI